MKLWLQKLQALGFDFKTIPEDLQESIKQLNNESEYNEKEELLDITILLALQKLFPNDSKIKTVVTEYETEQAQIVNDGFNTTDSEVTASNVQLIDRLTYLPDSGEIPKKYEDKVAYNLAHMGTTHAEWKATPIKGFTETEGPNGKPVRMPVFDFPVGYATAPTLFKADQNNPCCELCGHPKITNVFWLQNDEKKWTLGVGSECITHFMEGKSGTDLSRERKLELAQLLSDDMKGLMSALKEKYSSMRWAGAGKEQRHWTNAEAYNLCTKKSKTFIKLFDNGKAPGTMDSLYHVRFYSGENKEQRVKEYRDKDLLTWFSRNEKKYVAMLEKYSADYDSKYLKLKNEFEEGGVISERYKTQFGENGYVVFDTENKNEIVFRGKDHKGWDAKKWAAEHNIKESSIKTSAGFVIIYNEKILLTHPTRAKWIGSYSILKGEVESGEDYLKAALREAKEEIGLVFNDSVIGKLKDTEPKYFSYFKNGKEYKRVYYFEVHINDLQAETNLTGEIVEKYRLQVGEIDWAGFVTMEDARERMTPQQVKILEKIDSHENRFHNQMQSAIKTIDDNLEQLENEFGGRFVFGWKNGRFTVDLQDDSGLKEINIRGVSDLKEFRTKLKQWIKQNPGEADIDRMHIIDATKALQILADSGDTDAADAIAALEIMLEQVGKQQYFEDGGSISSSENFKAWFGNSKVVDRKGEPLIVYHGSPDLRELKKNFVFKTKDEIFYEREDKNRAFFFTNSYSKAKSYADPHRAFDYQNCEPGVVSVYLKIINPLVEDAGGAVWRKYETEINGTKIKGTRALVAYAREQGHDGLIVKNVLDYYNDNDKRAQSAKGNMYVVFSSEQIKLANKFKAGGQPETQNPKPETNPIAASVAGDQHKSISQKVEESLRKAQENKEFKDTARRVGGARKELAAFRTLTKFSFKDLATAEAGNMGYDLIKKDKVWEPYNIQSLRDAGVSSGTAFLIKKFRESFPAKPDNDAAKRKMFVGVANHLQVQMADIKTIKQFEEKIAIIQNQFTFYALSSLLDPDDKMLALWEAEMEEAIVANDVYFAKYKKAQAQFESFREVMKEKYKDAPRNTWQTTLDVLSTEDHEKWMEERQLENNADKLYEQNKKFKKFPKSLYNALQLMAREKGVKEDYYTDFVDHGASLMSNYFSRNFYNFMYRASDGVVNNFELAKWVYDELTPEKAEEKIQQVASSIIDKVISAKEKIALYKNPSSDPVRFEELFQSEGRGYDASRVIPIKRGSSEYLWSGTWWSPTRLDRTPFEYRAKLTDAYLPYIIQHYEKILPEETAKVKEIRAKYQPHDENWSWAFPNANTTGDQPETQNTQLGTKLRMHDAKPLSFIKRVGGLKINDADVTVANIEKIFGFKAVELGKYMEDTFSREIIRHFLSAMSDFGEILNMDLVTINSLNKYNSATKGLGIWFGIAGHGTASASYMPAKVVINLTKSRGQGALAHEFGHYLDSCMAYVDNPGYRVDHGYNYDGTDQYEKATRYYYSDSYNSNVIKNKQVALKLFELQNYIYANKFPEYLKAAGKYQAPGEDEKSNLVEHYIPSNKHSKSYHGYTLDNLLRKPGETDVQMLNRFIKNSNITSGATGISARNEDVIRFVMKKFDIASATVDIPLEGGSTHFALFSAKQGAYWRKPTEMFARALETYIYEKLKLANRENNYLVSGGDFDQSVYPQGSERKNIFYLFEEFFKAFKAGYDIPDFVPFTNERVDEVIELKDEKAEKTKKGVVVSTDGTVEKLIGENNPFSAQFKMLNQILTEELGIKYELGGSVGANFDELIKFVSENK